MIGGEDIILHTRGLDSLLALELCVRIVLLHWKSGLVQGGLSAEIYQTFAEIPLGTESELLIYRDRSAVNSWAELGAQPSNENTMIHILAYADGQITVVVDSAQTEEVRNLIGSIRKAIWSMSIQLMPLEMAA
jgi:hypothetical protein